MQTNVFIELAGSIDELIHWLSGLDRYEQITQEVSSLLVRTWTTEQEEAIKDALRFLSRNPDAAITSDETELILKDLNNKLGGRLAELVRKPIADYQVQAFGQAFMDNGVKFQFNTPDKRALQWLEEDMVYWIGTYYSREQADKVEQIAREIVGPGLSRADAAKLFREQLGDRFRKSLSYWEGMGNHVVTRSREFGNVQAYVDAGVEYLKIMPVLDHSTCKVCRFMSGRVVKVSDAIKLRDKLMAAKDPESVKKVSPWVTEDDIDKHGAKWSKKLPVGMSLPPFHYFCRDRTVMATEEEYLAQVSS